MHTPRSGVSERPRRRSALGPSLCPLPRVAVIALVTLAASASAGCGETPAPEAPLHFFKIEALVPPDETTVRLSSRFAEGAVTTTYNPGGEDVAVVVGPVAVREGDAVEVQLRSAGCADRKLCADYVVWMDGRPLARGKLYGRFQGSSYRVSTDGKITKAPGWRAEPDAKPPTLLPVDAAHPERGRLALPDELAQTLARGRPAPEPVE